jgi:DNA-binding NarL/FixJ family response regulator
MFQGRAHIIVLTTLEGQSEYAAAYQYGACAVVVKGSSTETLVSAIRGACEGGLAPAGQGRVPRNSETQPGRSLPLSAREREVAALVGRGLSNSQIASLIFVSEGTVRDLVRSILDKTGTSNRLELALYAIHRRLAVAAGEVAGSRLGREAQRQNWIRLDAKDLAPKFRN